MSTVALCLKKSFSSNCSHRKRWFSVGNQVAVCLPVVTKVNRFLALMKCKLKAGCEDHLPLEKSFWKAKGNYLLKYQCIMTRFLKLIVTPWNPNHKLLQQSVELLINLRAVPGPLQAWQGPCKGAHTEEDTGSHSSKDVHRGMCFPLRSYQVPLTLLSSNMDVLQPASLIHRTQLFSYHLPHTGLRFLWKYCLSVFLPVPVVGAESQENRDQAHPCKGWPVGIASVKQHSHQGAGWRRNSTFVPMA
ncbi:uncharacterized protein LOC128811770 [Vidua macroura]|uniref:uncharacterized protein LOC128811770 n=1 Tax=Vidua macroura TaxID=187451 RepID=UPI0023A83C34|nr:uncharacterized protein LOC128811770 [Vidua macroura]